MRRNLSIRSKAWSLIAVLAIPYTVIMAASLLLVSKLTTGSWQAAFLRIGWADIAGFEIGFLGVGIIGFAIAIALALLYNFLKRPDERQPKTQEQARHLVSLTSKSWQFRLLSACLVLPALTLVALHALALARAGNGKSTSAENAVGLYPINMGPVINTAYREAEPSFTADGRTMYFNCNNGDICVSHLSGRWEQGNWTKPERLSKPINTGYEEVEPIISANGDKLYFMSRRPGRSLWGIPFLSPFLDVFRVANSLATARLGRIWLGGLGFSDVYVSYRVDGAWSEPQNLNDVAGEPPVNTEFDDHCLFFSADGDEAFWTSTRPGGFGDDDIWTSRKVGGKWSQPKNLGPSVNGPGSEHSPIPTPNGQSLYITTNRAEGFGGEDIYITTRAANGEWGSLVNLGSLVNGPEDDRCAAWTPDLRIFLFDSIRAGGFGGRDVWWIDFKNVKGYPLSVSVR